MKEGYCSNGRGGGGYWMPERVHLNSQIFLNFHEPSGKYRKGYRGGVGKN